MKRYKFVGCLMHFKNPIGHFEGETTAISEKKAMNNLTYQCKKKFGLCINSNFYLRGILEVM